MIVFLVIYIVAWFSFFYFSWTELVASDSGSEFLSVNSSEFPRISSTIVRTSSQSTADSALNSLSFSIIELSSNLFSDTDDQQPTDSHVSDYRTVASMLETTVSSSFVSTFTESSMYSSLERRDISVTASSSDFVSLEDDKTNMYTSTEFMPSETLTPAETDFYATSSDSSDAMTTPLSITDTNVLTTSTVDSVITNIMMTPSSTTDTFLLTTSSDTSMITDITMTPVSITDIVLLTTLSDIPMITDTIMMTPLSISNTVIESFLDSDRESLYQSTQQHSTMTLSSMGPEKLSTLYDIPTHILTSQPFPTVSVTQSLSYEKSLSDALLSSDIPELTQKSDSIISSLFETQISEPLFSSLDQTADISIRDKSITEVDISDISPEMTEQLPISSPYYEMPSDISLTKVIDSTMSFDDLDPRSTDGTFLLTTSVDDIRSTQSLMSDIIEKPEDIKEESILYSSLYYSVSLQINEPSTVLLDSIGEPSTVLLDQSSLSISELSPSPFDASLYSVIKSTITLIDTSTVSRELVTTLRDSLLITMADQTTVLEADSAISSLTAPSDTLLDLESTSFGLLSSSTPDSASLTTTDGASGNLTIETGIVSSTLSTEEFYVTDVSESVFTTTNILMSSLFDVTLSSITSEEEIEIGMTSSYGLQTDSLSMGVSYDRVFLSSLIIESSFMIASRFSTVPFESSLIGESSFSDITSPLASVSLYLSDVIESDSTPLFSTMPLESSLVSESSLSDTISPSATVSMYLSYVIESDSLSAFSTVPFESSLVRESSLSDTISPSATVSVDSADISEYEESVYPQSMSVDTSYFSQMDESIHMSSVTSLEFFSGSESEYTIFPSTSLLDSSSMMFSDHTVSPSSSYIDLLVTSIYQSFTSSAESSEVTPFLSIPVDTESSILSSFGDSVLSSVERIESWTVWLPLDTSYMSASDRSMLSSTLTIDLSIMSVSEEAVSPSSTIIMSDSSYLAESEDTISLSPASESVDPSYVTISQSEDGNDRTMPMSTDLTTVISLSPVSESDENIFPSTMMIDESSLILSQGTISPSRIMISDSLDFAESAEGLSLVFSESVDSSSVSVNEESTFSSMFASSVLSFEGEANVIGSSILSESEENMYQSITVSVASSYVSEMVLPSATFVDSDQMIISQSSPLFDSSFLNESDDIVHPSTKLIDSLIISDSDEIIRPSSIYDDPSIISDSEEIIPSSPFLVDSSVISDSEEIIPSSPFLVESSIISDSEEIIHPSSIYINPSLISDSDEIIPSSTIYVDPSFISDSEEIIRPSTPLVDSSIISDSEEIIPSSPIYVESSIISDSVEIIRPSTLLVDSSLISDSEEIIGPSTLLVDSSLISDFEEIIRPSTLLVDSSLISDSEEIILQSAPLVDSSIISDSEEIIPSSSIYVDPSIVSDSDEIIHTSTLLVDSSLISDFEEIIRPSTLLVDPSIITDSEIIHPSTLLVDSSLISDSEEIIRPSTLLVDSSLISDFEEIIRPSTLLVDSSLISDSEEIIHPSSFYVDPSLISDSVSMILPSSTLIDTSSIIESPEKIDPSITTPFDSLYISESTENIISSISVFDDSSFLSASSPSFFLVIPAQSEIMNESGEVFASTLNLDSIYTSKLEEMISPIVTIDTVSPSISETEEMFLSSSLVMESSFIGASQVNGSPLSAELITPSQGFDSERIYATTPLSSQSIFLSEFEDSITPSTSVINVTSYMSDFMSPSSGFTDTDINTEGYDSVATMSTDTQSLFVDAVTDTYEISKFITVSTHYEPLATTLDMISEVSSPLATSPISAMTGSVEMNIQSGILYKEDMY